jgi:fermentation-respiration switch protein FrsA (DUF1100 family)
MKSLCVLVVLLLAGSLFAATSKTVAYKSGEDTVAGVLYTPEGKGPFPGLLVIHEWWGLNDWVKEQSSKLADQGYVVLAVDLYRGKVATTPDEAHEIMRGVPEDRAQRDLHAAVEFLQAIRSTWRSQSRHCEPTSSTTGISRPTLRRSRKSMRPSWVFLAPRIEAFRSKM